MPNPLDMVTEDQREQPGPARVFIYPSGDRLTGTEAVTPSDASGNALTQAVAPEQKPFDLMQGLAQLAELVKHYGAGVLDQTGVAGMEPGPRRDAAVTGRNSLVGVGDDQNLLWPQRMVKSGATLPGEVASGALPLLPPGLRREDFTDDPGPQGPTADSPWLGRKLGLRPGVVGPNQELIDRTQDTAGLMGGGALTERPGGATLGSGPVRPGTAPMLRVAAKVGDKVFEGKPGEIHAQLLDQHPQISKGVKTEMDLDSRMGFVDKDGKFLTREQAAKEYAKVDKNYDVADEPSLITHNAPVLWSDTQKPGAAIAGAASSSPAPVFYSALEHAATNAAQDVMSPQQWLGFLKNTPGVKAEELAWTGIGDWLGSQKGKVKKEDVQRYLDEHKVEIKDVTKEGNRAYEDLSEAELERVKQDYKETNGIEPDEPIIWDDVREFYEDTHAGSEDGTKYSSYQLPGGENYREHLLTLPSKAPLRIEPVTAVSHRLVDTNTGEMIAHGTPEAMQAKLKEMQPWAQGAAERGGNAPYKSSHWDEPNVLAHVRTNDRTMAGEAIKPMTDAEAVAWAKKQVEAGWGGDRWDQLPKERQDAWVEQAKKVAARQEPKPLKSLHIEEIQSDWHQQGRKQGYKNETGKANAEFDRLNGLVNDGATQLQNKYGEEWWTKATPEEIKTQGELAQKAIDYRNQNEEAIFRGGGSVPDAPFKTTWPELALKRMIRQAAEEGYDRISWTPGEAQAARYDLSKQIDSVHYNPETKHLFARNNDGTPINKMNVEPEQLPDIIGKEAADKIMNTKEREKFTGGEYNTLKNADLKVGGEGMREFYDKMLPKMAEKIGKAHGVKVKKTALVNSPDAPYKVRQAQDGAGGFEVVDRHGEAIHATPSKSDAEAFIRDQQGGHEVHYFDLPPSLKDHAIGKGFPLYMSGIPFPLTPVDYDPFKKDK